MFAIHYLIDPQSEAFRMSCGQESLLKMPCSWGKQQVFASVFSRLNGSTQPVHSSFDCTGATREANGYLGCWCPKIQ